MSGPVGLAGLPWALLAMEASLVYQMIAAWMAGPEHRVPMGPHVALAMMPLGYLAARYRPFPVVARHLLASGAAASVGARLLITPLPQGSITPIVLLGWLASAIVPGIVGWGLWWRGTRLADADLSAGGVRTEFSAVGVGLLILLTLYAEMIGTEPFTRIVSVVVFLSSGLLAVALARQKEAGAPLGIRSGLLVACCVGVFLLASSGLVAAATPEAAMALLAAGEWLLVAMVQLLALPFVLLFSLIRLEPRALELDRPERPPTSMPDFTQQPFLPEWVHLLLAAAIMIFAFLMMVLAVLVLLWALSTLVRSVSLQTVARAPIAVEQDRPGWHDLEGLLAALRRWLSGMAVRALDAAPSNSLGRPVRDARAAYRRFLQWAREHGVEREPWETPSEFQRRLALQVPDGAPYYTVLTQAYEMARYGGLPASPDQLAVLHRSLEGLARVARHGG